MLGLVCPRGTVITVVIEDEKDRGILEALVDLVVNGFGE